MSGSNQFTDNSRPSTSELLGDLLDAAIENNLQLKLLNIRLEAVFETSITKEDVDNGNDTGC